MDGLLYKPTSITSIIFTLILSLSKSANGQIVVARMGVCYSPNTEHYLVQKHCQTLPDCKSSANYGPDDYGINCYMRCSDGLLENNEGYFECEEYLMDDEPMICYQHNACLIPPTNEEWNA
mmetsp:Transcript_8294/g.12770  ORF Transcript_8294/g.12770 Transcript_8294/m.12770 type:complete len:121 (-) Transcript_8294:112-474(-)